MLNKLKNESLEKVTGGVTHFMFSYEVRDMVAVNDYERKVLEEVEIEIGGKLIKALQNGNLKASLCGRALVEMEKKGCEVIKHNCRKTNLTYLDFLKEPIPRPCANGCVHLVKDTELRSRLLAI